MHTETTVALVRTMGWQRTFSTERKLIYLSQTDVVVLEHLLKCDALLYHFEINPVVHTGLRPPLYCSLKSCQMTEHSDTERARSFVTLRCSPKIGPVNKV